VSPATKKKPHQGSEEQIIPFSEKGGGETRRLTGGLTGSLLRGKGNFPPRCQEESSASLVLIREETRSRGRRGGGGRKRLDAALRSIFGDAKKKYQKGKKSRERRKKRKKEKPEKTSFGETKTSFSALGEKKKRAFEEGRKKMGESPLIKSGEEKGTLSGPKKRR